MLERLDTLREIIVDISFLPLDGIYFFFYQLPGTLVNILPPILGGFFGLAFYAAYFVGVYLLLRRMVERRGLTTRFTLSTILCVLFLNIVAALTFLPFKKD